MSYLYVHPQMLFDDAYALAAKLAVKSFEIDLIIAIARGGLTVAQVVSDRLDRPVASFTIQSYQGQTQEKELRITYGLSADLGGKNILLVDDLADSGRTFESAITYLHDFHPGKIYTAALYKKPHSTYTPDAYVRDMTEWLIFPHEIHETYASLSHLKSGSEAARIYRELGISLHHR